MGQYPAHYRVPGTQSHNPEHHRQQAERLCTQQQNQTRPLGVRQPHPESFEVSSEDLGQRFDATCHIPARRSAVDKLRAGKFPLVQLDERVANVYLAPRFARVHVEAGHGTPLLQGSHVLMMRIHELKYISNTQTERMHRWIISEGTVLITCSGTIGRVALTTKKMHGWA